ncbi:hypothetical protein U0070_014785 [Myodes glareolus]|uniref:Uncharacterized protein n=1 Tax=Myodes glareolus TaxID=447135 RepID=A0AAW0ICA8_MYOGA
MRSLGCVMAAAICLVGINAIFTGGDCHPAVLQNWSFADLLLRVFAYLPLTSRDCNWGCPIPPGAGRGGEGPGTRNAETGLQALPELRIANTDN